MMVQWDKNEVKSIASMRVECENNPEKILERSIDDV